MNAPQIAPAPIPISRPVIGEDERKAVLEVLDSGMLVQGPQVQAFEVEFAAVTGVRHAIATSSGTTALQVALLANGIGPGDEVITSAFTFIASANSILHAGARPVFADVDEATFTLDPDAVEAAVTPRTKAIMPVHLYGQTCDMDALGAIAERHGLAIVEDAAQAIGSDYHGRPAGSMGTGCFSLYATKNVMSGEGGMITTDNDTIANRARLLRQHGMRVRYHHDFLGYNFRMTDLHAAIGRAQLRKLATYTAARRANAEWLNHHLTAVRVPEPAPGRGHVWHQYTVRLPDRAARDAAAATLAAAGIGTGIFYPIPAHRFDYMIEACGNVGLPVTDMLADQVLSLPVHPSVGGPDLQRIADAVNRL